MAEVVKAITSSASWRIFFEIYLFIFKIFSRCLDQNGGVPDKIHFMNSTVVKVSLTSFHCTTIFLQ